MRQELKASMMKDFRDLKNKENINSFMQQQLDSFANECEVVFEQAIEMILGRKFMESDAKDFHRMGKSGCNYELLYYKEDSKGAFVTQQIYTDLGGWKMTYTFDPSIKKFA